MPLYLVLIISITTIVTIYILYKKKISDVIEQENNHKKISRQPDMKPQNPLKNESHETISKGQSNDNG